MKGTNEYSYHSLSVDREKCSGRMVCMRVCPTYAIRIRDGKAKIISDRCIDCGECIRVCDQNAIMPLTNSFTDFSRFKYTIAIPSPAIYGQFSREILPAKIQEGLLRLGFNEVADLSDTCEAVSLAIAEFLKEYKGPKPLITTFCPTIVRLVQIKYPELVDNLLPIESPREIVAREIRERKIKETGLRRDDIGVIYITPCPAKMIDISELNRNSSSNFDGAVSISDIYGSLLESMSNIEVKDEKKTLSKTSSFGLRWAALGGVAKPLNPENWLGVSGTHDVMRILSDIEDRKISEVEIIECFSCEGGCIGGTLTVDNRYVARAKIIHLAKLADRKKRWSARKIRKLFKEGHFTKKKKIFAKPKKPLDRDISKAIERMKEKDALQVKLPQIDCGACGSPTCALFAEDVVLGHSKITDCFYERERRTKSKRGVIKLIKE